jgi:preprotein translocase subunit SecB
MSMAEQDNQPQGQANVASQPSIAVIVQYVKDLSFENPGAPQSLRPRSAAPNIGVAINVQANPVAENQLEIELKLEARATDKDNGEVLFASELVYAGIFQFNNVPPEQVRPCALVECPRLLFPFARQIIAEASRNGGFPQLLIEPVDFLTMYRQQAASERQTAN